MVAFAVVTLEASRMTKAKRGSDENLFSVSGAADALNRSRRTVAKALAGVKPDAVRSGLALWRMSRIIEAVNTRTEAPLFTRSRNGNAVLTGLAAEAALAFEKFDLAYDEMVELPTLEARRTAASALAALAKEALSLMRDRDESGGSLHRNRRRYA
jgi:hypothetical protein